MKAKSLADWRQKVLIRDNYTCQKCGKQSDKIEVHHIKQRAFNSDLETEIDNGLSCGRTAYGT